MAFSINIPPLRALALLSMLTGAPRYIHAQQRADTTLTIYFDTNISALDSGQDRAIANFAKSVTAVTAITGYADTVGATMYNRNLSRLRAYMVYSVIGRYTTPVQLPAYHGEEFQQSPGLEANRRVEVAAYRLFGSVDTLKRSTVLDSFDIENIRFIADQPVLTPESLSEVPQLVRRIKGYHHARFEIVGHVNYQSRKDTLFLRDLFKLSEQRARVIDQLLIENGIPKELIRYKGVGNTHPLIPAPANDEERRKNMRVQIIVIQS